MFTKEDLNEVRDIIRANKVAAPAKAGAMAPIDVKVSPVNTGLGPEKTSFFQALAIPTKITRGTIEILVCRRYCSKLVFIKGNLLENWLSFQTFTDKLNYYLLFIE